jgi:hypothetical protein
MKSKRNAYILFVGKLEGKRPLERYRRKWENNIKVDIKNVKFEGLNLFYLVVEYRNQCIALVAYTEHEIRGIYLLANRHLASLERLRFMGLVKLLGYKAKSKVKNIFLRISQNDNYAYIEK